MFVFVELHVLSKCFFVIFNLCIVLLVWRKQNCEMKMINSSLYKLRKSKSIAHLLLKRSFACVLTMQKTSVVILDFISKFKEQMA